MKNHKYVTLIEAANEEIAEDFIKKIKQLDYELSRKRLIALLNSHQEGFSFTDIAAKFSYLANTETSAD